jgi:L-amino acid N-acyltransferase YncA
MKIESDKKADFDAKLAYYNQLIEEGNDTLETRQLDKWLEMRAQELGYVYK